MILVLEFEQVLKFWFDLYIAAEEFDGHVVYVKFHNLFERKEEISF